MKKEYWVTKWQENNIGFHEKEGNSLLKSHFKNLELAEKSTIFVPLCGMTEDIDWLLHQGHHVIGVELYEEAIVKLFARNGLSPKVEHVDNLVKYSSSKMTIYCGDFFNLTPEMLGNIDLIYDRAALVALPQEIRDRYASYLMKLTDNTQQLLINFSYDQQLMSGPPFSVEDKTVRDLYSSYENIEMLDRREVFGGLKGKCVAEEKVWLLS